MKLKNLFTEDRAVSPVIGVILMVAITVILAAVIGTFVIGLGDDLGSTTPSASIDAGLAGDDSISDGDNVVQFTHRSGDSIDYSNLGVSSSLTNSSEITVGFAEDGSEGTFSAGQSVNANATLENGDSSIEPGDTISLIYDDGSRSSTLKTYEFTDTVIIG